jgi:hypothetical protein
VFREKLTDPTSGRSSQQAETSLSPGNMAIISAADRPSRETTNLLVLAREMQQARAFGHWPNRSSSRQILPKYFAIPGVASKLKADGVKFSRSRSLYQVSVSMTLIVMAWLDQAIHVFATQREVVDGPPM